MRRILLILILLISSSAHAQGGGQFCARAFEDRNGNGQIDAGEPFLTRGVSVNLLNVENIVVASALLDDSPTAAQGVICFQFLEAGQYTLEVTSADYTPTTSMTFTAAIGGGTLPTVVEYGGQRIVEATSAPPAGELDEEILPRIVISGLGALIVVAGMVVLGALIYLLALRPRRPARPYYATPRTGDMSPVVVLDDDIPDIPRTPTPGEIPVVKEDTDEIKPVT